MKLKPIGWIGSSKSDLRAFPGDVIAEIGHALYLAQLGEKHLNSKPLKGFMGASVLEVVEDFRGDTFRAVYTVKFAEAVYVLHAFQKKAKKGISTPSQEIEKVKARLKRAEQEHQIWLTKNP